jgi:hypothetical protein
MAAYNYLEESDLADALHDSEEYTSEFYGPIPELQRLTRGKPGKIPKGKPRVTEGTLASIRRQTPKQIIQQLPSGFSSIRNNDELQNQANAVLKDVIIANANSGGTPFAKAKRAIKSTFDVGSAWAWCFYNRTGAILHADYKLKNYADVLFEKGKVSEFDMNYQPMVEWMTESDIKAIMWQESQRKLTKSQYDLKALQRLLDHGPSLKPEAAKTPAERKANSTNGYYKWVYFFQRGVEATWYIYAPSIKETLWTGVTKDPRGIIPIHGLIAEDDDDNPLGEPLAGISAGKQNLLDFDMQMYQYGQAKHYSPTVKKWGDTPKSRIRLLPDEIIEMNGTKASGDDFEAVNMSNDAIANFGNNYGLIKTQIQSEMGNRNDSSVSSESGNPDFSKTSAGVKQGQQVTDNSNNDLRVSYELWQGRIFETLLNIQYAESKGKKDVDFKPDTIKRYKLEDKTQVDYDAKIGPISYHIEASSSQATNTDAETEKLSALMDKKKDMENPDDKDMLMYNQIVRNTGVADPEKLLYTDDEITRATEMRKEQQELAHAALIAQGKQAMAESQAAENPQPAPEAAPPQPKTLGESITWKPGDLSPEERAQALAQVGVKATTDGNDTPNAQAQAIDAATKADKHVHDTAVALSDHVIKHTTPPPLPTATHQPNKEPANVS